MVTLFFQKPPMFCCSLDKIHSLSPSVLTLYVCSKCPGPASLRLIYLFEKQLQKHREVEPESEIFHYMVHYPSGQNSQKWTRPKPGASSASSHGCRVPGTWAIAFPDILSGNWMRSKTPGTWTGPIWDSGAAGGGLILYHSISIITCLHSLIPTHPSLHALHVLHFQSFLHVDFSFLPPVWQYFKYL